MIKELQITLYDVFGYLLPGAIFLAGIGTLFWTIFLPQSVVLTTTNSTWWVILVLLAYFAGHMAQAIGNLLEKLYDPTEKKVLQVAGPNKLPDSIIKACRAKAQDRLKTDISELESRWLYRLCDDAVVRSGMIGERDVYVYREGFYRGTAVSSLLLAGSVLTLNLRLWCSGHTTIQVQTWDLSCGNLWFFFVIALGCSYLSFHRYRKFGMYRVTQAVLGFLNIKDDQKSHAGETS